MRFAATIAGIAVAVAVSGGTLFQDQAHAASGEEIIKARIAFMQDEVEDQWKVLANFAKGGKGTLADVEKSARALANLSKKIAAHFPKDTGRGKFPDKLTRSLPAIWTDWTGFEQSIQLLATETEKLARLAREGNRDAVVELIGPSGSYGKTNIGCVECHSTYRGARAK